MLVFERKIEEAELEKHDKLKSKGLENMSIVIFVPFWNLC
jgi:hypothetical protein